MIRILVRLALIAALAWSAWWAGAAWYMRGGISAWFDARTAEGWQADYAEIATSGYPLRHVTRLAAPALADPETGVAWSADWITFDSPAAWPGRQRLSFADTPQRLSYFDDTLALSARDMRAELHLRAGLALELETLAMTAGPWLIDREDGRVMAAEGLTLAMARADPGSALYRIELAAPDFSPGNRLRRVLASAESLPEDFDTLALSMTVLFDRPWDRRALEERRPQPRRIDLRLAEARWGALLLSAAGELDVDGDGIPTGALTVRAEDWREMLGMAERAGALPASVADQAERMLDFIARLGPSPDTIDVQLNFRGGYVALGPFPLGPAPRLILR